MKSRPAMIGRPFVRKYEDRKSTRLNSSHTVIYTLSLHDALPIFVLRRVLVDHHRRLIALTFHEIAAGDDRQTLRAEVRRSEEHTSELQSHRDLHSFPTRRSSDLRTSPCTRRPPPPVDRAHLP